QPDRDLRAGKERLHRLGEDMRGIVTDEFERSWVVAGDELDSSVARQGIGEVAQGSVEGDCDSALGERWRNAFGNIEPADAGLEWAGRSIRECYGNQGFRFLLAHSPIP